MVSNDLDPRLLIAEYQRWTDLYCPGKAGLCPQFRLNHTACTTWTVLDNNIILAMSLDSNEITGLLRAFMHYSNEMMYPYLPISW